MPRMFRIYSIFKATLNAVTLAPAFVFVPGGDKGERRVHLSYGNDLNGFAGTRAVERAAREPLRLAVLDRMVLQGHSRMRMERCHGEGLDAVPVLWTLFAKRTEARSEICRRFVLRATGQ